MIATTALVTAAVVAPQAAGAAGFGTPVPLTTKQSVKFSQLHAIGVTSGFGVIYNSAGNNGIYRVKATGTGLHRIAFGGAVAVAAGELFYERVIGSTSSRRYLDLTNGDSGARPADDAHIWNAPAPHGGLHVGKQADGWHVTYFSNTGVATPLGLLPDVPNQDNVEVAVISSDDGFAVVATPFTGPSDLLPIVEFNDDFTANNFVHLDSTGGDTELICNTLTAAALGCSDEGEVLRISTEPGTPAEITNTHAEVGRVAATTDFTAYTTLDSTASDGEIPACPCSLHTIPVGETSATAVRRHLPTSVMTGGDGGNFYYSAPTASAPPGLFRAISAAAAQHRIATSPHRDLFTNTIALGPGLAAWSDDSVAGNGVFTRTVKVSGSSLDLGSLTKIGTGLHEDVSASGSRIAFGDFTDHDPIVLHTPSSTVTIGHGMLGGISGLRVLYRTGAGHWIVRDLVTHKSYDATIKLGVDGDQWPALWGDYLAYFGSDGSVWRKHLVGDHARVRLGPAIAHSNGGMIQMWGDWVAWRADRTGNRESVLRARNAQTMTAAHTLGNAFDVVSASAAGVVVTYGANRYKLLSWPTASLVTKIPSFGDSIFAPAADGQLVAYSSAAGRPVVAKLHPHVTNRPRSLGNPSAPSSIRHGETWYFDLVTSAPLTSCKVRIMHGTHTVHTANCNPDQTPLGEVRAIWHASGAGSYRWKVVARNADGTLLAANGDHVAPNGTITVH